MEKTAFNGMTVHTNGNMPKTGENAPDFTAVKNDLSELTLSSLRGKRVVMNIFPSLDTGVCATSVRKFNQAAASLANTAVLALSLDLPFAQGRFCTTEGIENVTPLSLCPLKGLMARCVIVVNEDGKIIYEQLVPEITQEPDYEAALAVLK